MTATQQIVAAAMAAAAALTAAGKGMSATRSRYWKNLILARAAKLGISTVKVDRTSPTIGRGTRGVLAEIQKQEGLKVTARLDTPTKAVLEPHATIGQLQADTLEKWAAAGWKERPAGSNYVPELAAVAKQLHLSTYLQRMRFFWCEFGAMTAALLNGSVTARLGLVEGKFNALYTVDTLHQARARKFGMKPVGMTKIRRGTNVELNWKGGDEVDHYEVALASPGQPWEGTVAGKHVKFDPPNDEVVTAGCNTSYQGAQGSQSNGGCVAVRTRKLVGAGGVDGIVFAFEIS